MKERLDSTEKPQGFRAAGAFVCRIARRIDAWADKAAAAPPLPHQVARMNNGTGGVDTGHSQETQTAISRMLEGPAFALSVQALGSVAIPEGGFTDYKDFLDAASQQYARLLEESEQS
jgi:hypothetical protein